MCRPQQWHGAGRESQLTAGARDERELAGRGLQGLIFPIGGDADNEFEERLPFYFPLFFLKKYKKPSIKKPSLRSIIVSWDVLLIDFTVSGAKKRGIVCGIEEKVVYLHLKGNRFLPLK